MRAGVERGLCARFIRADRLKFLDFCSSPCIVSAFFLSWRPSRSTLKCVLGCHGTHITVGLIISNFAAAQSHTSSIPDSSPGSRLRLPISQSKLACKASQMESNRPLSARRGKLLARKSQIFSPASVPQRTQGAGQPYQVSNELLPDS
jgi:hypothetical protein